MRYLWLVLLLGGERITEQKSSYWADTVYYTIQSGDSVMVAVNGEFINTGGKPYQAFPRLYYGGRVYDGGLGYTARLDRSSTATDEDRFQPIHRKETILPTERLRVKVLTGWIPHTKDNFRLVFVINGKEQ